MSEARLDSLRERGAARLDPVRLRYLEALARRAAGHGGLARQWLDRRLAAAIEELDARLGAAAARPEPAETAPPPTGLADLVRRLDRGMADGSALPELNTLRHFKRTWTRLGIDQQLSRSRAKAPDNPGPLNSHRLVLQSLQWLQAHAPAYLDHFMPYADALLWLDHNAAVSAPASPMPPGAQNAVARRRSTRPARR